jgi:hypothetical protein
MPGALGGVAPDDCRGELVAVVTNNLNVPVEMRARLQKMRTPMTLGSVVAGERREFYLVAETALVFPYVPGGMTARVRRAVNTQIECRG